MRKVSILAVYKNSLIIAVAMSAPVWANSIPAATFNGMVGGSQNSGAAPILSGPGAITNSGCPNSTGCGTAALSIGYTPGDATMSISGTTSGGALAEAVSFGETIFWFEAAGAGTAPVPLIFTASGTTSVSGPVSIALVEAFSAGGGLVACSATGANTSSCTNVPTPASFSASLPFTLAPNTWSDVELVIKGSSVYTGNYSASVDPMITIDPAFADASQYSLVFSPGSTASAVPEPATLLLMGAGLIGIACLSRWLARVNEA